MDTWIDGQMNRSTNGWMDGQIDWMDGQIGWMDGWMDRWIDEQIDEHRIIQDRKGQERSDRKNITQCDCIG